VQSIYDGWKKEWTLDSDSFLRNNTHILWWSNLVGEDTRQEGAWRGLPIPPNFA
jgi:hypothetical protein